MSAYHATITTEAPDGDESWTILYKRLTTREMISLEEDLQDESVGAVNRMIEASNKLVSSYELESETYDVLDVPFEVVSKAVNASPFLLKS